MTLVALSTFSGIKVTFRNNFGDLTRIISEFLCIPFKGGGSTFAAPPFNGSGDFFLASPDLAETKKSYN